MITLHRLHLFALVYERGSFNQAASALYLAQSSVSQQIIDLERELGVALFDRGARGVTPTEAGTVLYSYARRILAQVAEAERAVMEIGGALGQQLAVGATPGISVYLLPIWLQRFQQGNARISVSLQTALTGEVVRDVLNARYNLGFLEGELGELDQDALGRMRLYDIDYALLVNARHPLAQAASLSPQALAAEPFINRQPTSRARRWMDGLFAAQGVRLHNVAELDSPGAIKYALLNGMGATILPLYAVERELARGEVVRLHLEGMALSRPLLMVWDRRTPFSPLQRAFIHLLAEDAPALALLA